MLVSYRHLDFDIYFRLLLKKLPEHSMYSTIKAAGESISGNPGIRLHFILLINELA